MVFKKISSRKRNKIGRRKFLSYLSSKMAVINSYGFLLTFEYKIMRTREKLLLYRKIFQKGLVTKFLPRKEIKLDERKYLLLILMDFC